MPVSMHSRGWSREGRGRTGFVIGELRAPTRRTLSPVHMQAARVGLEVLDVRALGYVARQDAPEGDDHGGVGAQHNRAVPLGVALAHDGPDRGVDPVVELGQCLAPPGSLASGDVVEVVGREQGLEDLCRRGLRVVKGGGAEPLGYAMLRPYRGGGAAAAAAGRPRRELNKGRDCLEAAVVRARVDGVDWRVKGG